MVVARRPAAALVAGAALLAMAATVRGHRPAELPPATAAYVELAPADGLVHVRLAIRTYVAGALVGRSRTETWYTATREHLLVTRLSRAGVPAGTVEFVRSPGGLRSYAPVDGTVSVQANCWSPATFPSEATADPIGRFQALYRADRVMARGTLIFGGERVVRLVAVDRAHVLTVLTRPDGVPVAFAARLRASPESAGTTGIVARVLAHDRRPLDADARRLLAMRPHPGAPVVDLARAGCPAR